MSLLLGESFVEDRCMICTPGVAHAQTELGRAGLKCVLILRQVSDPAPPDAWLVGLVLLPVPGVPSPFSLEHTVLYLTADQCLIGAVRSILLEIHPWNLSQNLWEYFVSVGAGGPVGQYIFACNMTEKYVSSERRGGADCAGISHLHT